MRAAKPPAVSVGREEPVGAPNGAAPALRGCSGGRRSGSERFGVCLCVYGGGLCRR